MVQRQAMAVTKENHLSETFYSQEFWLWVLVPCASNIKPPPLPNSNPGLKILIVNKNFKCIYAFFVSHIQSEHSVLSY